MPETEELKKKEAEIILYRMYKEKVRQILNE